MEAENIVVWVERELYRILIVEVDPQIAWSRPETGHWCDPIGAAYTQWREMNDRQRVTLMLETAVDLAMNGFDLGDVLREFAKVRQFRALGEASFPMCRALTKALIGHSYEFNTMSFEELLVRYASNETTAAG
jgi:hypothetical protein